MTHELPCPKFGITGPAGGGHSPEQLRRAGEGEDAELAAVVADDDQAVRAAPEQQRDGVPDGRGRGGLHAGAVGVRHRVELDLGEPAQRQPAERAVLADELRDEVVGGVRQDRVGGVVLGEHAAGAEDRDPVAHLDRLVDVVGDEDHRLRDLAVQPPELLLQARARDRVERAERLVHQEQRRVGGERAGEPDALALAARELRGVALRVALLEPDELEQLGGPLVIRPSASRGAWARWRCSRRPSCAGRGPTCWIT